MISFRKEIRLLANKLPVHRKSELLPLNPFLDQDGILRVGGRLKEAMVDFDSKHQIIIHRKSTLAELIINDAHEKTKHGGTQLTMSHTRNQYWIIQTRRTCKNQISKCVTCHEQRGETQEQLMGQLPNPRVNLTRAFTHTGVDYAGPQDVLVERRRGPPKVTKGYIALFVCLCTKAIHIEVVSDMTAKTFLAAFTRFTSTRGNPTMMYSDNGTTFVGAKNEIFAEYELIKTKLEPEQAEIVLKDGIEWSFIPSHAPHWGGLWESGVKSMKHHLKRMTGDSL